MRLIISPSVLRSTRMCPASSVSVSVPHWYKVNNTPNWRGVISLCVVNCSYRIEAGIEQPHEKAESLVESERPGNVFRRSVRYRPLVV